MLVNDVPDRKLFEDKANVGDLKIDSGGKAVADCPPHHRKKRNWVRNVLQHVAAADQAEQVDDSAAVIANLTSAVELWRGDPLVDLASLDELGGEIEYVSRSLVDTCQRLGELLLVAGRFDEALRCAERSRVAAPYSERAHRLAIACHLQRRDRAGLESAVRSTRALLDELGVEPEAATSILVRRASVLLGPPRLDVAAGSSPR